MSPLLPHALPGFLPAPGTGIRETRGLFPWTLSAMKIAGEPTRNGAIVAARPAHPCVRGPISPCSARANRAVSVRASASSVRGKTGNCGERTNNSAGALTRPQKAATHGRDRTGDTLLVIASVSQPRLPCLWASTARAIAVSGGNSRLCSQHLFRLRRSYAMGRDASQSTAVAG